MVVATTGPAPDGFARQADSNDWRAGWVVPPGFKVEKDAEGFRFPTTIVFVPNPGPNPDDPLYFVTELRGAIKVVTRNRAVHTFAEGFFDLTPEAELPAIGGETGLAGISLEPENGYVFASFAYMDQKGVYRNGLVRFQSQPGTFSLKHSGMTRVTSLFDPFLSAVSHQIGPVLAKDGALYVSVGDAEVPESAQSLKSPNGKILRMTYDGKAMPDNPFYSSAHPDAPQSYIWAYGMRNAFGLAFAGDRLFAADNGPGIDRFLEVPKGLNGMYDGTDWSIGINADAVFSPAVSPVQMIWLPLENAIFPPQFGNRFYTALSGTPVDPPGPHPDGARSVISIEYDLENGRVTSRPQYLLRFVDDTRQSLTGVGVGPDGLYVVPILPFPGSDRSPILKVSYDPEAAYPYTSHGSQKVRVLLADKGCYSCHSQDPGVSMPGPHLAHDALRARLLERLHSDEYLAKLDGVDQINESPFSDTQAWRDEIRGLQGMDRVQRWVVHHLRQPRFDNPAAQMPDLGITESAAKRLADWLLKEEDQPVAGQAAPAWIWRIKVLVGYPFGMRGLGIAFIGGMAFVIVWRRVFRRR